MKTPILSALLLLSASCLVGCQPTPDGDVWPLAEHCDWQQDSCSSQQGDASVTVTLQPQPLPIAKPFNVAAQLHELDAVKVELDISGINMYMGYNRVPLIADTAVAGRYQGVSMLAFCTNDVMQWQFTILIHQATGEVLQVPFQIETRNR